MKPTTKDECSILLYIESRAVDNNGLLCGVSMNDEDREILRRWRDSGYVKYGRIPAKEVRRERGGAGLALTEWAELSDDAWRDAAQLRRERAERNPCVYVTVAVEDDDAN